MKKTMRTLLSAALALSLLSGACGALAFGMGETRYTLKEELSNDLTYINEISEAGGKRVETFALEYKPAGGMYPITGSGDTIYGGLTINQAVTNAEKQGYNIVAAVNTDFYSQLNGVPLGLVIENGEYKSSPEEENALCIDEEGRVSIVRRPEVKLKLQNAVVGKLSTTELTHLNKYRTDTGLYLYTSAYSTVSTRAVTEGWAVRFRIASGTLGVNSTVALVVDEILEHTTSVPIGDGYIVLTAAYASGYEEELTKYAVGDMVLLTSSCTDQTVSKAKWASGGGDILVENGALTDSSRWDKAIAGSNPRTAVGVKADGTVVWLVVEGRRSAYSVGADLTMLAEQMASLGCTTAMNLDGGGASAMAVRKPGNETCTVVNAPSDGTPRPTGAFALLVCRTATENKPERLFLKNDGVMVLSGASVTLDPAATDRAMRPIALQSSISATVTNGSVKSGVYTAGAVEGPDTVSLVSGDARGTAMVYTVTAPDTVVVKDAETNREISTLSLKRGESVRLDVSLRHLGRDVTFRKDQITFSADEAIGTITTDGVFTAGKKSNLSGSITIKAGGTEWKLPVTIPAELEDIEGHWSETYVQELFERGIVTGVTPTEFKPNDEIRRADFVLMLYRAAGKPAVDKASTFSDVPADAYYSQAVAWAQSAGIAAGTDLGTFEPAKPLLREQGFTFLYRYLKAMGKVNDETKEADLSGFKDASQISAYALTPVKVLVELGTVSGDGGLLTPLATMTRGQMAKVLCMSL